MFRGYFFYRVLPFHSRHGEHVVHLENCKYRICIRYFNLSVLQIPSYRAQQCLLTIKLLLIPIPPLLEMIGRLNGMGPFELCIRKVDIAGLGSKHSSVTCAEHTDGEAFPSSDQSVLQTALTLIRKIIETLLSLFIFVPLQVQCKSLSCLLRVDKMGFDQYLMKC